MMKSRLQSIILRTALLFIAMLGTTLQTHAYSFEVDGIYYNIINDTEVEVTYKAYGQNNYSGAVTIPSQVMHDGKSYTVTRIGDEAFVDCSDLIGVAMPITIKYIGCSFYRCTALERVVIPDSVEEISGSAFRYCDNLNEVVIGESVCKIGYYAFAGCYNLTKLTVGKSVTQIGDVFGGCNKIKELIWNAKNCEGGLSTGSLENLTIGVEVERLPFNLESNNGLKTLTWNARDCPKYNLCTQNFEEVILGEEVQVLPDEFLYNSKITQINVPPSVKRIGRNAFNHCYSLSKVYISDLSAWMRIDFDTYVDADDPEEAELYGGYRDYDDEEEESAPAGAYCKANPLCYGAELFMENVKKTTVVVPDDITEIKFGAFSGCKSLNRIIIGNHVTSIGSCSFDHCPSLKTVEIGDSITTIPKYSFIGSPCTTLTIGRSVESIGPSVFSSYTRMVRIYDLNKWCEIDFADITSNPLYNKERDYENGNYEGTSVLYLYWSKQLGFRKVESLDSLTVPHCIKDYAFAGCYTLKTVETENIISSIGCRAFYGCENLTSVNLSGAVDSIAQWAFALNNQLTDVVLSTSLSSIGEHAFDYSLVHKVTSPATVPPTIRDYWCFYFSTYERATLEVPEGSIEAYQNAIGWKEFKNISSLSPQADPNDVNLDGEVNVADVNALINIILSGSGTGTGGDVNGDGEVTIADVNALINYILNN